MDKNLLPLKESIIADNDKKPTALTMANTKLSNALFDEQKDFTNLVNVVVSNEKAKKKIRVPTQVFLSAEEMEGVEIPQKITAYDRAVHDGVCSIIVEGETMTATNRQIYEAMTGKSTTSPQALGHITRSLNKMNRTKVSFDYTEQANAKGKKCDKIVHRANIIDFEEVEVVFNKTQSVHGYKFLSIPILHRYATAVGQIITVSSALLDLPHVTSTEDSIILKHYLLRRIEAIKNKKNHMDSRRILFKTMFDYCGINGDRVQLRRKREVVFAILQDWKDMRYIKNFTEYKGSKGKILGVDIEP